MESDAVFASMVPDWTVKPLLNGGWSGGRAQIQRVTTNQDEVRMSYVENVLILILSEDQRYLHPMRTNEQFDLSGADDEMGGL